ncbi:hypothetical protein EDB82DRAFT_198776 [Fusarium venenatum]|uniref:uncharacterized protein n=1 Tax=Fusarium venenatum TaxID=56646 RepID=UPI001D3C744E|nr:hypothetical protein EDB82DRAFT_198776 [Fusarium venenatum]
MAFRVLPPEFYSPNSSTLSLLDDDEMMLFFPATCHAQNSDLTTPSRQPEEFVAKELDLRRLTEVSGWLWFAGRLEPPRPLHLQLLLGRAITCTEQMDLHLIWSTGRIFIKPIPRFLLNRHMWGQYLSCKAGCSRDSLEHNTPCSPQCGRQTLRKNAHGFLFSWAALVRYESDFWIAKEKHLIPNEVEWPQWVKFVESLNLEHIYPHVSPRFYHGELRLSRLDLIYRFWYTPLNGYLSRWNQYATMLRENFDWLAVVVVYVVVILTAMQVGLATETLAHNEAFVAVSYQFSIFSIFVPIAFTILLLMVFCFVFSYGCIDTIQVRNKRLRHILQQSLE